MYWRRDFARTCIIYHLAWLKKTGFDRREVSIGNVFLLAVTLFRLSVLHRLRCSRRFCGRCGVPLVRQRAERIPRAERREQRHCEDHWEPCQMSASATSRRRADRFEWTRAKTWCAGNRRANPRLLSRLFAGRLFSRSSRSPLLSSLVSPASSCVGIWCDLSLVEILLRKTCYNGFRSGQCPCAGARRGS